MLPGQLVSFILFLSKCYNILSFKIFRNLVNSLTSFLDLQIVTAETSGQNISSQTYFQVILLRFLGIDENGIVAQKRRTLVLELERHHHFLRHPLTSTLTTDQMMGPVFS